MKWEDDENDFDNHKQINLYEIQIKANLLENMNHALQQNQAKSLAWGSPSPNYRSPTGK